MAVRRCPRAQGFLCKDQRQPTADFRVISFEDILRSLAFAGQDVHCLRGEYVVKRTQGWPMGGSMSEPATLVDLGEDTRRLYVDPQVQRSSGLLYGTTPIGAIIQGLQHVDDALLMSKLWCGRCLLGALQRTWPTDCGTNLEEEGHTVRFLSAVISVGTDSSLCVRPHYVNARFARGLSSYPEESHPCAILWAYHTPLLNDSLLHLWQNHCIQLHRCWLTYARAH